MKLRWKALLGALISCGSVAAQSALAAGRVALLIGNTAYPGAPGQAGVWDRLPNAANDVQLVAAALKSDGFDVEVVPDGKYKEIMAAIRSFAQQTDGADVAVLYYAGHGFEYSRRNYLVPIDAPTSVSKNDLSQRFVDFEQVANEVAQARVNVFFLDACRTGVSFVRVSDAQAVADVSAARTIDDIDYPERTKVAVLFSTARGQPALDAAPPPPGYSPFAWQVARDIVVPHVDLGILFETIRDDVSKQTQEFEPAEAPYYYSSVGPGLFLNESTTPVPKPTGGAELQPIDISGDLLAITDEPILIVRVLRDHPLQEMEALAERGDPLATYLLGYMFEFGVGVPTNLAKALDWLEKAAAAKTPSGELELGYFLERHPGSPQDKERALRLYEAAAQQGFAKAQAHLAAGLMDGSLAARTPENYDRGLKLLRNAAAGGYPYAMFSLAQHGDQAERPAYKVQLRQIADAGNADGNQWLCELAAEGGDYHAAIPDCAVAARAGSATAQARLAIANHDGRGVPQSSDEGRHWARLALSQTVLRKDLRTILLGFNYRF